MLLRVYACPGAFARADTAALRFSVSNSARYGNGRVRRQINRTVSFLILADLELFFNRSII